MSTVVIAPFSNSSIRNWPSRHYATLIGALLDRRPAGAGPIRVIGTAGQRSRAHAIVRHHPADRVVNDCGRSPWGEVLDGLRTAACVVGNNSGIAHLAASFGTPTVCIFGGSHQRQEWRPLGPAVTLLTRTIGCSPCHLDHGRNCPYGLACLDGLPPGDVADTVLAVLERGAGTAERAGCPTMSAGEAG